MTLDEQGQAFRERGVITRTFELADSSVLAELRRDADGFKQAVEANSAAGLHCVPYDLTDAIARVAHDSKLTEVIAAILGAGERWVMWGANIQEGTPNDAGSWHVDLESRLWPTITVAVGIDGCSPANSTRYIPYSQKVRQAPALLSNRFDDSEALRITGTADTRCSEIVHPADFDTGRFYVFDARGWHSGERSASQHRTMLFLHYHRASEPRIPLMLDYQRKVWSTEPAPYLAGPDVTPSQPVNLEVHRPPSQLSQRVARLRQRIVRRSRTH